MYMSTLAWLNVNESQAQCASTHLIAPHSTTTPASSHVFACGGTILSVEGLFKSSVTFHVNFSGNTYFEANTALVKTVILSWNAADISGQVGLFHLWLCLASFESLDLVSR